MSASFCGITRFPFQRSESIVFPARRTRWIASAGWWTPRAANEAYASAISSALTPWVPSVIEQTGRSGEVMPSRWATVTTLSGPTSTESWA